LISIRFAESLEQLPSEILDLLHGYICTYMQLFVKGFLGEIIPLESLDQDRGFERLQKGCLKARAWIPGSAGLRRKITE